MCDILEVKQGGSGLGDLSSRPSGDGVEKASSGLMCCASAVPGLQGTLPSPYLSGEVRGDTIGQGGEEGTTMATVTDREILI